MNRTAQTLVQRATAAFEQLQLHSLDRLGIAVSGGGDSMALLQLLAEWQSAFPALLAVSVDHGLRPAAANECRRAAEFARQKAIPHVILPLDPSSWSGNQQAAARDARYAALASWARDASLRTVALGHTRTDQAETVLINLARGSGVDGLAAMPSCRRTDGIDWVRPLLAIGRTELRTYLRSEGVAWVDDPGNESVAFQRIRARKFLMDNDLRLSESALAMTAGHLQAARDVLDRLIGEAIAALVQVNAIGEYRIKRGLWDLDATLRLRMLALLVRHISDDRYPPRTKALINCLAALKRDGIATIGGGILLDRSADVLLVRDHRFCRTGTIRGELWDRRWKVQVPQAMRDSCTVGPLGPVAAAAIARDLPDDYSQRGLAATPALWRDGTLAASVLPDGNADVSFVYCRGIGEIAEGLAHH